mgnify:CR=1 FL=1
MTSAAAAPASDVTVGQRSQRLVELAAARHAELGVDPAQVVVDGPDGQVELLGDLVVGVPERDQLQDLELALGEGVGCGRVGLRRQPSA